MKDHNFYSQIPSGELVVRWNDDQARAQIIERPNENGFCDSMKVASLMNLAYRLGKEHKQKELLMVLGVEGNK